MLVVQAPYEWYESVRSHFLEIGSSKEEVRHMPTGDTYTLQVLAQSSRAPFLSAPIHAAARNDSTWKFGGLQLGPPRAKHEALLLVDQQIPARSSWPPGRAPGGVGQPFPGDGIRMGHNSQRRGMATAGLWQFVV